MAIVYSMNNYFITGISGFVGRNLVLAIKKRGPAHIYGLVLPNDPAFEFYKDDPDVTLVEGDLCNEESVRSFLSLAKEGSYLIHCGGRVSLYGHNDPKTMEVNFTGTKYVIDNALDKGFLRILYVSSVDALCPPKEGITYAPGEYDPEHCQGIYGKSKAYGSQYVRKAWKEHGLPVVIVNPSAIIGPDDPFLSPMNDVLRRFALGKVPVATPGGYDTVDVRDVAEGSLLALEKGKLGESYLLVGNRVSVKELFEAFAKTTGRKAPKMTIPFFLLAIIAPFAEFFARLAKKRPLFSPLAVYCLSHNPVYDLEKAKNDLGYSPRPLQETSDDTYAWLKQAKHL